MKYIAMQSVGKFKTGEEVTGLTDERAEELLEMGAIQEVDDGLPLGNQDQAKEPPKRGRQTKKAEE